MTFHPYMPATLCATCLKPESNPEHQLSKRFKSYWIHWNTVVKNDAAGRAVVTREAARRSTFLLNQWDSWMIPYAKVVNPSLVCLVYKDASSTRTTGAPFPMGPTGVDYRTAEEAWFLHNTQGQRMQYEGYAGHWRMNVGHPSYQTAWATQVRTDVLKGGFDGVFIDNLLFSRLSYGPAPREYADDAAFRTAYLNFLQSVRNNSALLMYGNLSNARLTATAWESYISYLDGAWDEWWLTFSDTDRLSDYAEGWRRQVLEIQSAELAGKVALVQPHFTGTGVAFRYSLASFLAVTEGLAQYSSVGSTDGYGDPSPWHAEFDWNLGAPITSLSSPSTSTFKRKFQNGMVVINARASGTVTFSLGATYLDSQGVRVSAVAVGPKDAAILRSDPSA